MRKYFFISIFFLVLINGNFGQTNPCSPKQAEAGIVCVCNSTYCDDVPPIPTLGSGQVGIVRSSLSGQRFFYENTSFSSGQAQSDIVITINGSKTYQQINGFGGAFTGTASYNMIKIGQPASMNLFKSYFGPNGIGYTLCRVTIGASDFSLKGYSYDDVDPSQPDFNLTNFQLDPEEDLMYKIPAMQLAQSMSSTNIKFFGSPWSPPPWMKNNSDFSGAPFASIIGSPDNNTGDTRYYSTYANYFYRFFQEHAKHNITFWGLTIQNEPTNQMTPGLYLSPENERDFLKNFLGPKMRLNSLTKDLKIMIWDYNRPGAEDYSNTVLADKNASMFVDGVAIHWYHDDQVGSNNGMNSTVPENIHANYPNKFILNTEACAGNWGPPVDTKGITLGNWTRGEFYAHDILDNLNHWTTGWVDWNMVLNESTGPAWRHNPVEAPIIVNNSYNGEFYKQPLFYALGHFSKFIIRDSVRIDHVWNKANSGVDGVAAQTPDNQRVLVLHNRNNTNYTVTINDVDNPSNSISTTLEAKSIATLIWNRPNKASCSCPGNWYQSIVNPCNCYMPVQTPGNWLDAWSYCPGQNLKAKLASIDSAFENSEILSQAKNFPNCTQFFIGMEYYNYEWVWSNGDQATYRNWREGFPLNSNTNECSQLNVKDGKWTNIGCGNFATSGCLVCEIKNT